MRYVLILCLFTGCIAKDNASPRREATTTQPVDQSAQGWRHDSAQTGDFSPVTFDSITSRILAVGTIANAILVTGVLMAITGAGLNLLNKKRKKKCP